MSIRSAIICGAVVALALQAHAALGQPFIPSATLSHAELAPEYPTSEAQYEALKRAAHGGTRMTWDKLPDWSGIWLHVGGTHADMEPPLNAKAKALYAKTLADLDRGIQWDQLSDCLPAGFPRLMTEPFEREFVVRPEEVWLHNVNAEETRRIYLDGRGHMPEDAAYALWEGDSVGFWDGDRLVIHTTHVRAYPQAYYRSGPPQSDKLSAVEVMRKIDADHIEDAITIYDPEYLTTPWRIHHRYQRVAKGPTLENRADQWVCNENSNVEKSPEGATIQLFPGDPGYKRPEDLLKPPGG